MATYLLFLVLVSGTNGVELGTGTGNGSINGRKWKWKWEGMAWQGVARMALMEHENGISTLERLA